MTPFGKWLAENGLGSYESVFADNKIDFDVIHQMTDADLRELGLALGDRKRLLQAVAKLTRLSQLAPNNAPGGRFPVVGSCKVGTTGAAVIATSECRLT